ncbi:MAG: hypothetical protein Q4G50_04910 [Corynebacterium sp.]|nr:hypothetical protein [Corynebacterium sp.]
METPDIFIRAADWAHARDFGCPAGISLRRVLLELTGPPRVGACTLDGPVALPDWPVREVTVTWPVLSRGVDLVFLIHPGPLTAAIRSRVAAGPQVVRVVPQLPATFPDVPLIDARRTLLRGELHALATRYPHLAAELLAIAGPAAAATRRPRLAVISPGPVDVDLPGCEVVAGDPHVDAVVALAPPGGWTPADHPTLLDAARRAGRLISTAPLPADIPGTVLRPGQPLIDAVHLALRHPAALPDPRPGAWLRAVDLLHRRRPAPGPAPFPWEVAAQAVVFGALAGLAAGRAGLGIALCAAVTVAGMRWWTGRREAHRAWIREEAARHPRTPQAAWVRRQLAKEI